MKKILFLLVSVLLITLILGGMLLYNRPLGQALDLTVPEALAASLEQAAPQEQAGPQNQAQPQKSKPPQSNDKTCGGKGVMRLIAIGQASPMDDGHEGADAVRLVWVNFDSPAVVFLAIPSDLWVAADALDDDDYDYLPLNELYQVAYDQASSNNPNVKTRKATQALAQALVDNYGFVASQYLTLQDQYFVELVDQADIQIDVTYAILDVPPGWHTFQPGLKRMNGDQALDYVRVETHKDEPHMMVWERFSRQNQVMLALCQSAIRPENWDQIGDLVKTARKMVVTDLSVSKGNSLACMLELVGDDAELIQLPQGIVTFGVDGGILADPADVREEIEKIEARLAGD